MNYEENRLQTFREWPANSIVSPERIARAGFYYTGTAQTVQCFLCGITLSEWNYGDQVMALHRNANPECPFVLDPTATPNVPFTAINNRVILPGSRNNNDNNARRNSGSPTAINNFNPMLYSCRLNTFKTWPIPHIVQPQRLARSGFWYLQKTDMVRCVYCQGVILKWEAGDDPDIEHRLHFPNCNFYSRVQNDEDQSAKRVELGNMTLLPGPVLSLAEMGIQYHSAPKEPRHTTYESRLNTFVGWPTTLTQTPEMMAEAGFYYVGIEDQVRCFHCHGGLLNWEQNDDVWVEHAKWFPRCGYVCLTKGSDFVRECVEARAPLDPAILDSVSDNTNDTTPPPSQPSTRYVTDVQLEALLRTPPAVAALEIGIQIGRVRMALKRRMEQTGIPYADADQLIEDATQIQLDEDHMSASGTQAANSPDLTDLLSEIIHVTEAANTVHTEREELVDNEEQEAAISTRRRPQAEATESGDAERRNDSNDRVALEEENRKLKEARLCKICMDREVAVVFLPCGHLTTCVFCAPSIVRCPMCRREIRATVRTFMV